jgi:drug/metabolite transporter (DMT)-like permease
MAVIAALAAALCYAIAAALEQQQAEADVGVRVMHPGLLWRLVRRPRWLAGFAVGALGAGLHLLALTAGPLTTVQPVGVLVVVFAVPLGALLRHRRAALVDLLAAAAVSIGLAVLVSSLSTTSHPVPPTGSALCWTGACGAAAFVLAAWARRWRRDVQSVVLSASAAVLLGITSALVRAFVSTGHGIAAFLQWGTLLLVGCVIAGTVLEQGSYKVGRLAATVAVMTVVDPLVSIGLGSLLLGQSVHFQYPVLTAVAAPVVILGVVALARRIHGRQPPPVTVKQLASAR